MVDAHHVLWVGFCVFRVVSGIQATLEGIFEFRIKEIDTNRVGDRLRTSYLLGSGLLVLVLGLVVRTEFSLLILRYFF